ncbi:DUF4435 domain-containing protein [Qipengyuania sp. GH25]|uniref:DUF4435 domain-containing protein n=1 Tax=Qipengyuania pacifica TaxID=2860199 RepID=A0ABS7JDK1_9SPHN|nr:DUF4435 domain-containing protein [Qipengyuania aerophila]MBX7488095.1 DUF4435 domain-containing protein [Qipengyuania aerophila]
MSKYTVAEFFYRFRTQEPDVNVLIVEGPGDTKFWSLLAPSEVRNNSTIMAVDAVEVTGPNNNGSKERALELARLLVGTDLSDRVKIFVDADNDHILATEHFQHVLITDYRDIEGYVTTAADLQIIVQASGCSDEKLDEVINAALSFGKIVGLFRAANDDSGAGLRITKTIERNPRRYFQYKDNAPFFDRDRLLASLLGGGAGQGRVDAFRAKLQQLEEHHVATDPRLCVRGKDIGIITAALIRGDRASVDSSLRTCLLCNCTTKLEEANLREAYQHVV